MFGKSAQTPESIPRQERNEQSFLQNGVRVKGEIEVDGDLRIEGSVEGSLVTRGVLLLGPKSLVQGDVRGREVVIHGKIAGTIRADERIQLAKGAKVKGDIYCRSLVVEEGVYFEGRSHMGEAGPKPGADPRAAGAEPPRATTYLPGENEAPDDRAVVGDAHPKRTAVPPR